MLALSLLLEVEDVWWDLIGSENFPKDVHPGRVLGVLVGSGMN